MKFITTENENGKKEVFLFPREIPHDAMAEMLGHIKNQTYGNWHRVFRKPVAAGFVYADGTCHGRSESLDLKASKEDTALLRSQGLTPNALAQADAACGVSPGATGCASNGSTENNLQNSDGNAAGGHGE